MINLDSILEKEISEVRQKGLFRELKRIDSSIGPTVNIDGREVILFSSNNYLGLANHPEVKKAQIQAIEEFGAGSCASRLISGNISLYEKLEENLAIFKGTESAIVFPTGYMANIGVITALVGERDIVICDKLNHASIIDGARMSGAVLRVYPHKNLERLEDFLKNLGGFGKRLVITDTIFSMDGDIAPLQEMAKLVKKYNAFLMIDDAHGTGVLGDGGKGVYEYFGIKEGIDIQMGTLSKAFGNLGGFICGSKELIEFIRNKARPFIYTTALPPAILGGSIKALSIIDSEEGIGLRKKLWSNVERFRNGLIDIGYDIMDSKTQIIPILIGDLDKTMKFSERLFQEGIFAPGIRPPTVPKNKCRIRVSIMATHTDEQIDRALGAFRRLERTEGRRGTMYEGRWTKDDRRQRGDEGRRTMDEGRGTMDERRGTRDDR